MERFVIIVNCWKPLTIITKCSILNVAAVLDRPLEVISLVESQEHRQFHKTFLFLFYEVTFQKENQTIRWSEEESKIGLESFQD